MCVLHYVHFCTPVAILLTSFIFQIFPTRRQNLKMPLNLNELLFGVTAMRTRNPPVFGLIVEAVFTTDIFQKVLFDRILSFLIFLYCCFNEV
jgi:hypothetical protein